MGDFIMYDIDLLKIGQRLKQCRLRNNLSTDDLGKIVGKSKTTIIRYENRRNYTRYNYSV